jgi:hypothetical protein
MLAGLRPDDVPADHRERWPQGAKLVDGNADRTAPVGRHVGQPARLERSESISFTDQTRCSDGLGMTACQLSASIFATTSRRPSLFEMNTHSVSVLE